MNILIANTIRKYNVKHIDTLFHLRNQVFLKIVMDDCSYLSCLMRSSIIIGSMPFIASMSQLSRLDFFRSFSGVLVQIIEVLLFGHTTVEP